MNAGLEKAKAVGTAPNGLRSAAPVNALPLAKQPSAAQAAVPAKKAVAKGGAKLPNAAKQVEPRMIVAPKFLKRKAAAVKPEVAKTRCFAQVPVKRAQSSSATISASNRPLQFPVSARGASLTALDASTGLLSRLWRWIRSRQMARSGTRRLHVSATASLGEKRFVAVIQVDGLQFLVGGGATNVVLLAQLDTPKSFGDLLNQEKTADDKRPGLEQMGVHA